MTALTVAARYSGLPAYQWNGSEEDAQGLALWLVENNMRPSECRYVRYHGVTFHRGYIALNGTELLPGEYIVIIGKGMVVQVDEDQFGDMYQVIDEIKIMERK